jgi:hypothetical protein
MVLVRLYKADNLTLVSSLHCVITSAQYIYPFCLD